MRREAAFLADIVSAADELIAASDGLDRESFFAVPSRRRAALHLLILVGKLQAGCPVISEFVILGEPGVRPRVCATASSTNTGTGLGGALADYPRGCSSASSRSRGDFAEGISIRGVTPPASAV
jgi:hypothetical protein